LRGSGYQKPIIGLSAGVSHAEQKDCLDAGMNDFIAKPIILDELWGALTRWLPPVQNPGTVRIETAETRFMGNRDALARARAAFIACHADDAEQFRRYLAANDHKAIYQLAHSLKGAASILGFDQLAGMADTLERTAQQGAGSADLEPLIDRLNGNLHEAVIDADRSVKDDG